jgi:23S rRNA (uridine2552-2'-O)-methyltransferase
MARKMKDYYFKLAKKEGYRSRAAFKLKQINKKFKVIGSESIVVDLGASPGGWSQVASEITSGKVVAVDISPMPPLDGVEFLRGDITNEETLNQLKEIVKEADVVICDASPNLSGRWSYDHARSIFLAENALKIAENLLKEKGNFVVKVFQGDLLPSYVREVKSKFYFVKLHGPKASRKESAEIYVVAKGFKKR